MGPVWKLALIIARNEHIHTKNDQIIKKLRNKDGDLANSLVELCNCSSVHEINCIYYSAENELCTSRSLILFFIPLFFILHRSSLQSNSES